MFLEKFFSLLLIFVFLPLYGACLTVLFIGYVAILKFFLILFNIKPPHYKYISYNKLVKYSKIDYLKDFIDGGIEKNLKKINDDLTDNAYFLSHPDEIIEYTELIKKNKIKNFLRIYTIFTFIGFITYNIFEFAKNKNFLFLNLSYEFLGTLIILVIFILVTIFYYILDYLFLAIDFSFHKSNNNIKDNICKKPEKYNKSNTQ